MNEEIKEAVEKLFDQDEWIFQLSAKTKRSVKTINRHWKGKYYNIPRQFQLIAFDLASKLYKKEQKKINNIKVNV